MKKNTIIILLIAAIAIFFGFLLYETEFADEAVPQACTMEAKICPDGSAVGRSGPSCEFAVCPMSNEEEVGTFSELDARAIAEQTCIKAGETLAPGYYNENSKTWWFDATLNNPKEGCHPACVVSEETKIAEINWRCTGLISQKEPVEELQKIFVAKYPKYAQTIQVIVDQEVDNHVRGSVIFESGAPGGLFLALKVDGVWQIVFEGNGAVDCNIMRTEYGFSDDILMPNICN
ncbi:hypothetical protein L6270_04450 [Candidatus Parcubacteria bacterium]|nr:hypothetical protein [Patescibacteria group bacterium]MBU4309213.1 hypothetical protein [Patescibacteria group bacterium]MBU4432134.1 hypothetical protein [Patescibacteria group bacterium]MBU4577574.1 hypothetical protein [Patescibacteria group bacterium]MCG2697261.1 hypothetical protein [Candidatus Parcubacteria bacterium]